MNKLLASFLFLMVTMGVEEYTMNARAETPVATPEEPASPEGDQQTKIPYSCPNCGMG